MIESMRYVRQSGWQARLQEYAVRDTGLIKGVCAHVADLAGVPAWVPRAAFLIFGLLHWLLAVVAYVVLAKFMFGGRARPGRVPDMSACAPPPGVVRDRFGALDARLAELERASLQQDTNLRRAFRDLERH